MTNRDDFWSLSDDESDNDYEHYVHSTSIHRYTLHLHLYLTEETDNSVDWMVWTNTTGTVGMDGTLLEPHGGSHGYASDKASALRDAEQVARHMILDVLGDYMEPIDGPLQAATQVRAVWQELEDLRQELQHYVNDPHTRQDVKRSIGDQRRLHNELIDELLQVFDDQSHVVQNEDTVLDRIHDISQRAVNLRDQIHVARG